MGWLALRCQTHPLIHSNEFAINFQHWTEEIMKLAYNLTQMNGSCTNFLQKAHTKLCLQVDKTGKIPVKKWVSRTGVASYYLLLYIRCTSTSLAAEIFIISIFFGSIIKQLASNKDDRKRVEKALDVSGLPSGKGDSLPHNKFHFEDFFNLYKNLTQRSEVEKIFEEL